MVKKNYQLANQSKFVINKAQTFKDRNNFHSNIWYININFKVRFL